MTDPILRTSGITKRFHGIPALSDVSLEVAPGELIDELTPEMFDTHLTRVAN